MVQSSLHGHMVLVNRVEIPTPAAKFTSADANHFLVHVQAPACHFVAGMSIGDTHAIFGQPFRHCRSDVRPRRRREGFHISRPAARCCRQDGPLVRHQTLGVRDFLLARPTDAASADLANTLRIPPTSTCASSQQDESRSARERFVRTMPNGNEIDSSLPTSRNAPPLRNRNAYILAIGPTLLPVDELVRVVRHS